MTGRLVTLEGGEGVGKSTQARRLAEVLENRDIEVMLTREPGGSPGAEAIRELLLSGEGDRWSVASEALLFAAARADHVERTIRPALKRGALVLCDRFIDSSVAYQGIAGGLGVEAVAALHRLGSGGLMPDRTLLLRLPPGESGERARRRDGNGSDRIGGRDSDFHASIAAAFDEIAAAEPDRVRVVDASGPLEAVTNRLVAEIEDLL